MEPRFQTSFIPKKPIVAAPTSAPRAVNLFSLMSTIILVAVIVVSGGVFFYNKLVKQQLVDQKKSLELAKASYEPDTIRTIIRADSRIETSKKLFASHIAVTPFFDFLSSVTLEGVRFRDFNYVHLGKDKIQVQMKGQAANYASVALQSDLLNEQDFLKDTNVGDMSLDVSGAVLFTVSMAIDPSLMSFSAALTRSASASEPVEEASAPEDSASTSQ